MPGRRSIAILRPPRSRPSPDRSNRARRARPAAAGKRRSTSRLLRPTISALACCRCASRRWDRSGRARRAQLLSATDFDRRVFLRRELAAVEPGAELQVDSPMDDLYNFEQRGSFFFRRERRVRARCPRRLRERMCSSSSSFPPTGTGGSGSSRISPQAWPIAPNASAARSMGVVSSSGICQSESGAAAALLGQCASGAGCEQLGEKIESPLLDLVRMPLLLGDGLEQRSLDQRPQHHQPVDDRLARLQIDRYEIVQLVEFFHFLYSL